MVDTLDLLNKKLKLAAIGLVNKTAASIIDQTIQSMRIRKSGVKYTSLANRSSARGETPAYQSGDLARSIEKKLTISPISVTATITVGTDYSRHLVRLGRPILSPAAKKAKIPFLMNARRLLGEIGGGSVSYGRF
jgi:hypothetical protein